MANSRKDSFRNQILQIGDAFLVWLAFWIGSLIRNPVRELLDMPSAEPESLLSIAWVLYIAVPFTPLVLERFDFYRRTRLKKAQTSARQLVQGIFIIGLAIALFALFAKLTGTPRLILGTGAVFMFLLLFTRERITAWWLKRRRKQGASRERVIIAGTDHEISEFLEKLEPEVIDDWEIVERFDLAKLESTRLFDLLKLESVGRVIFVSRSTEFEKVAAAIEICELQGVEAWVAASFIRTQIARPTFDSLGSKPMLVLRSTPDLSWELLAKELMDRVLSLLIIIVTSPLWLIAIIGIKIASPGAPVFFSQQRAGRYGKPFKMLKFRTMVANAEELLASIKEEHGNEMEGPVFKLNRDPRIFPFGALLRRLSIDELPQLLNALLGDMSLVGPRPLPLYEVEAFSEISHRRRLSVKPGITCEWQIGGRNQITNFEDWVEMDLRYIDNWSLWLDCHILVKTVPAVLFGKGAR
jgi:exopolysaccharide biosynthesis polyprenyl glycosylphosphotransferase